MKDCQSIFAALSDYLDRELSTQELTEVQGHLERCPVCAEEFRFEESILRHVRGKLNEECCPEELRARIKVAIELSE